MRHTTSDRYGFCARVAHAQKVIWTGKGMNRKFDDCFEMYDGEQVAVIIWRKAQKEADVGNLIPLSNLQTFLSLDYVKASAEKFSALDDWQIRELAFDEVDSKAREFIRRLETMDSNNGTDNTRYINESRARFLERPKTLKTWQA